MLRRLFNIFARKKEQPEPPLCNDDGLTNREWLNWYMTKFKLSLEHAVYAAQLLRLESNEPWFDDFAEWTTWILDKHPDITLEEFQDLVLMLKQKHEEADDQPEPRLFDENYCIREEWVKWYSWTYACSEIKAHLEGAKLMVRQGLFVQGITVTM